MKNSFKIAALALVVSFSFAACNSANKSTSATDSAANATKVDSAKKDTSKKGKM